MYRSCWIGVITGCLGAVAASGAEAVQHHSTAHPLSPNGRVRVETVAGALTVRGSDRADVSVEGTLADDLKLEVSGTEGDLLVQVKWPKGRHRHWNSRDDECTLEIQVPASASLETESVSASVDVNGVNGETEIQTVSGDVKVAGNPERLDVEVVSGNITLDVGTQRVRLEAVSGDLRARIGGGEFEASVVSGDVVLEGEAFESVDVESVSGDIEFAGALNPKGEVEISSHSGDVDVALRGTVSAKVGVTTFSGSIRSELGGESERTSKYAPGEEYERTIGEGTGRVTIDAFSGTVRLRRI